MADIDCVVHLAGASVESPWDKVLPLNIEGCYNTFEAARRQGVKRVIFASSNHAVGFHRRERFIDNTVLPRPDTRYGVSKVFGERFIDNTVLPRPDTRYGVSKVFGEAVGRLYADKYGLSVACLRIGTFRTPDRGTPAPDLDQPSRHGTARTPQYRSSALPLRHGLRRLEQPPQPLG